MPTSSNRLIDTSSPYLRQHADNPVAWQPWDEEAFKEARRRDVPVLVSIGYSTCHWCHVMAHESFEDPELADLMNAGFVCIKVDREEHPEVDAIYMDVCQAMNGQGGWPLHAICDPLGRPFFAGTYFPPAQWRQVLNRVDELWRQQRHDLQQQADRIKDWLQQDQAAAAPELMRQDLLRPFLEAVQEQYDQANPGFGSQPRFPPSCSLLALLALEGDGSLDPVVQTVPVSMLTAMQDSGLHDRVGGGFHRYSVDAQWRVPHFEKMLYDNALLMAAYAQAAQ
ncbi:MAG: thioredoxin domain-containing protein, partial [Planctomycetota bacterium]